MEELKQHFDEISKILQGLERGGKRVVSPWALLSPKAWLQVFAMKNIARIGGVIFCAVSFVLLSKYWVFSHEATNFLPWGLLTMIGIVAAGLVPLFLLERLSYTSTDPLYKTKANGQKLKVQAQKAKDYTTFQFFCGRSAIYRMDINHQDADKFVEKVVEIDNFVEYINKTSFRPQEKGQANKPLYDRIEKTVKKQQEYKVKRKPEVQTCFSSFSI